MSQTPSSRKELCEQIPQEGGWLVSTMAMSYRLWLEVGVPDFLELLLKAKFAGDAQQSKPNVYNLIMSRSLTNTALLVIALITSVSSADPPTDRPKCWAQPIDAEGVPNLFKVSDSLYRSAQPTAEGMRELKGRGIVTVINLRSFHSDRDEIGITGLAYEHIYMKAWHPERKEALRFLQIVTDPKRTPVLVHCQHGADRTGTMTALYRIVVQGWSKEEAIREMTDGGFGFNEIWVNLPDWIRNLDVDSIRREVGIKSVTDHTHAPESAAR